MDQVYRRPCLKKFSCRFTVLSRVAMGVMGPERITFAELAWAWRSAIGDRVVRMHNGSIQAYNAREGGLVIDIQLPLIS